MNFQNFSDSDPMKKCPFLAEVTPLVKEAGKEMQDDVIESTGNPHEGN